MPRRAAISKTSSAKAKREIRARQKAAVSKSKSKSKAKAKAEESDLDEPTGLTSDESSSSELSDASDFEPEGDEEEEEEEEVEVISVSSGSEDEPPRKKPRSGASKKQVKRPATKASAASGKDGGADADQRWMKSDKVRGTADAGGIAIRVVNGKRITALNEELSDDDDVDLEDWQQVVGRIYPAPRTGRVPAGRISNNTLLFLKALMNPTNNDRDWFRWHEPAFRQAEKEFRDFVDVLQERMAEVDEEVPVLPAKDICHRIYRDVRFTSDKTPYKCNFAFTTSRGGRKGIWAKYHVYIEPGYSIMACGLWQPDKTLLQRLRDRILGSPGPGPLQDAISSPEFVALFGPAEPDKVKGKRQNVFGHDDELKMAPKGIDKNHPLIHLLRLRTIAVVKHFTDDQVLDPGFRNTLVDVVRVMAPFVHTLNDYIAPL
ncbi:hypothetical protein CcaverHIS002_0509870 [Cutaneotrichosporon cavernicola]|uniref:TIGR02453 family protein n=1 Tax=Cutaneotrichosporon cavernicola TaxID=279322 RepID=A0AA48L7M2_9TREE|nr:uncharacterized protein CcaverHIS019_0510430 [Cutaneotrichosporon cavernicola]BEI85586.1 hypothetical protein CcaverHIS002_0509870 [Cutaneotrichosporon cavernicola]BEI93415.1 hypothetical protein CcaverHIS019_0510430 [Cutaneotrichosporon cavernicola]BEJ01193.1 hypothetical protein CcaverHIS631_0510500 [Cutaneotrichosporon cavernicola]BEJ08961.1 hypothetical protein CcaverHIS641_0510550 [Cutaneotrichosporon cavernicola]